MTRQEKAQAKRNRRAFWRKDPSNYALRNVGSGEAEREAWRRKPRKAEAIGAAEGEPQGEESHS